MGSRSHKTVASLTNWFLQNARPLPWRKLPFRKDPYAVWVSEIMLQQTQVKTVLSYWERWMRALPNIQALAEAPAPVIHKLWEGLGYYTRVRNMQKAARAILDEHDGNFPRDFEAVLALPGIGRYTAGAICSIAFGQPAPILDGNVIRVLTRLFGIDGNPHDKAVNAQLWTLAKELVELSAKSAVSERRAKSNPSLLNQALMELGALICTPRQPKCASCPLANRCVALQVNRVDQLPALPTRVPATARKFVAFVAEHKNRLLVRQRPTGVVNAQLWEFPNVESDSKNRNLRAAARKVLGHAPRALVPLCVIRHTITRYRITLEAFQVQIPPTRTPVGTWLPREEASTLAFCSAHKRILQHLT